MYKTDDYLKKLKANKDKVDPALRLSRELSAITPELERAKMHMDWQASVLGAQLPDSGVLVEIFEPSISHWENFPQFMTIDTGHAVSACSATEADSTVASGYIFDSYISNNSKYKNQSVECIGQLNQIMNMHDKEKKVSQKLHGLAHEVGERFDTATATHSRYANGTATASDLAKDMRNVFERFKGEINLRRPKNIANKKAKQPLSDFSWNKMADELTNKPGGADAKRAVMQQQKVQERLFAKFTKILKKQSDADPQNIETYYQNFIDHLHALIGLLDSHCFS